MQLEEKVCGPNLGGAKSKTTRRKNVAVTIQAIETPDGLVRENEEISLCVDRLNISSLEFLAIVSYDMYHRPAARLVHVGRKSSHTMIEEIFLLRMRSVFHMTDIRSGKQLKKALELLRDDHMKKSKRNQCKCS